MPMRPSNASLRSLSWSKRPILQIAWVAQEALQHLRQLARLLARPEACRAKDREPSTSRSAAKRCLWSPAHSAQPWQPQRRSRVSTKGQGQHDSQRHSADDDRPQSDPTEGDDGDFVLTISRPLGEWLESRRSCQVWFRERVEALFSLSLEAELNWAGEGLTTDAMAARLGGMSDQACRAVTK